MAGTLATYQGYPCRDVRFRRTRGWTADTSTVLLFAADFPQGFEFVTPRPGDFTRLRLRSTAPPDLGALRGGAPPRQLPLGRRLEFAGALVLAEVDLEGREFLVEVDPLFCVSLETVRRAADGSAAVLRATLVDARYFASQGFLRRWSFNRTDGEGLPSLDSLKPDGALFSLAELAQEVAQDLLLTPELSHVPEGWERAQPAVEFPRFGSATAALVRLAQEHGAEPLCLNLDGSLALWEPGEGRVGFAPGGEGAGNSQPFPPGLQLYLNGQGQNQGAEASYPPDWVVVVGGLRVATVVLDDLDPVLVVDDVVIPLTEESVRKLTEGKHGLDWLQAFVLAPQAYQNATDVDPRVVQLLREQAYRLWRLPDVEREVTDPGQEGSVLLKGPNAHLLPLRPRAETSGGRRLPVRVDGYRFASVHRAMAGSQASQQIASARRELRQLQEEIRAVALRAQKPDPWTGLEAFFLFQDKYVTPRLLYVMTELYSHAVSYEAFQGALARARLVDRIREVSPSLAARYEQQLVRLLDVDALQSGAGKALHELAKEIVAFEKEVAESRDLLETPDAEADDRAEELRDRIQATLRELDRQRQARASQSRVGASPGTPPQTAVFLRNLPRELDSEAAVYSAELGVVRTSELCGHLEEEGVPVAEATRFVPKSPLVSFGAVLRPRVDRPLGPRRPVTGAPPESESGSYVPEVLSDAESYFVAAFRRLPGGGVEPVNLEDVPRGQGVAVERPDLVELIPQHGRGNRVELGRTALEVAQGLLRRAERVEHAKYSLARPWPVNCDGVVSGVEIALRPQGKGFVTTIYTGGEAPLLSPLGQTRVRVRRGGASDAAAREGLTP